jgi:uncharacterized membrane protein YfcA
VPDLAWQELLIIAIALAAGGTAKGLTGLGLPMVAVPVLAGFLGVERAVMIMIMPVLVLNIWLSWTLRDCAKEVPEMRRLLLPSIPGVLLGAGILYLANERLLSSVLAIWILVYLVRRYFSPTLTLDGDARRRVAPAVGFGAGAMQAATGISAPVLVPYVDSLGLSSRGYVFAVATVFSMLSGTHFIVMMSLQAYSLEQLAESMLAVIPAIAFVPLGSKLRGLIEPQVFTRIIRVLMFVMAMRLIYGAWLA